MSLLLAIWNILCQLAPWLLLGMLLSGIMHVVIPTGFIRRRFRGTRGVISAVSLGVPLPLCSCGVVPAGIGLKNEGASDGAAVGFLISTPQTGVDSILVSASFFGWPFAIFKMVSALITGVVGGLFAEKFQDDPALDTPAAPNPTKPTGTRGHRFLSGLRKTFSHGIEIVRSIWVWLVIGIVISAVIEHWMPSSWIESISSIGLFPSMLLVLLVSTPLYVCATASVPIAAALVAGGLPPAAAMVFLMAGPATNATTVGAVYGRFGWKTLAAYLISIIGGSMIFAWLFDWLISASVSQGHAHVHDHQNWISLISGIALAIMMGWFAIESIRRYFGRDLSNHEDSIQFEVDGMNCQSCVSKLESQLRKNPGVSEVEVRLHPGAATVTGSISPDELRQEIQAAGFQVPDEESHAHAR